MTTSLFTPALRQLRAVRSLSSPGYPGVFYVGSYLSEAQGPLPPLLWGRRGALARVRASSPHLWPAGRLA